MKTGARFLAVTWLLCAMALLLCGEVAVAATYVSPVGTWDFTVSGCKTGAANLIFNNDYTVTGFTVVVPGAKDKGGTDGVAEFGYAVFSGQWYFNQKGQVAGYLQNPASYSTRLDIDSFVGKVSSDRKSFTFTGSNEDGNLKFTGVPFKQLAFLPTTVSLQKTMKRRPTFTELFSVEAVPDGNGNLYQLNPAPDNSAANLCVEGVALLSRANNLTLALYEYKMPTSGDCNDITSSTKTSVGSAATGRLNLKTNIGTLKGVEQGTNVHGSLNITMPVFFK